MQENEYRYEQEGERLIEKAKFNLIGFINVVNFVIFVVKK